MLGLLEILGLGFVLLAWLVGALAFVFWVWMLINALTNKGLSDGEKIAWVLVIIFVPVIGPIIYFFIGRPKGG